MPPGTLDLIGDVHGELDALAALLARRGWNEQLAHDDPRRLVFLGDLYDRGPDSSTAAGMNGSVRSGE